MFFNVISWNIDPEMFSFGPLSVRYYGLCFAISFMLGYYMLEKMFKAEKVPEEWLEKLFMYVVVATILGARLGHVFFYGWDYYSQHPGEILKVWNGGLASHGGGIGIILAIIYYSKKVTKKSPLWTLDRVVIAVALAGFFIRFGNLMNSEIYGHVTNLPWGIIFERNGETLPKHPTQLYEAFSYLIIFCGLFYSYWKTNARKKQGLLFGSAIIAIFIARFLIEFVKENQEAFEDGMMLNMGQLLSLPFIATGVYLVYKALPKK